MNLSTKADEYLGSLTFDNETMYFTRKDIVPKAKGALTKSDDRKYQEKFMFAKHLPDGTFTKEGRGMYAYCVGEKGGGIWSLIDKEAVRISEKNIANPWA